MFRIPCGYGYRVGDIQGNMFEFHKWIIPACFRHSSCPRAEALRDRQTFIRFDMHLPTGISRRYAESPEGTGIRSTGSLGLYSLRSICRKPSVMSNDQNPDGIPLDTKKKVDFRVAGRILNKKSEFRVKVVGKVIASNPLVVIHDCINLREDLRMEDNPETHLRWAIRRSNCSILIPLLGSESISASRRSASAIPSSESVKSGGRVSRMREASVARCCSGSSKARLSTSVNVIMLEM